MIQPNELFVNQESNLHCKVCGNPLTLIDIENKPIKNQKPVTNKANAKNSLLRCTEDVPPLGDFKDDRVLIDTLTLNLNTIKCVLCKTCRKCHDILWIGDTPDPIYHKELLRLCNAHTP